jgi:hypothetical protein
MSQYYSDHDSPDDLVEKYTSPALGAARTVHDDTPLGSSGHGKAEDMTESFPSSPPFHSPAILHHRTLSTNSGHFSRAELFGRSSPDLSSSTRPPSRGLERIENRRAEGFPVLEEAFTPSPLTRTSRHGLQALTKRQSTQSLRGEHALAYSFPDLSSSRTFGRASPSHLRPSSSSSMQDSTGNGFGSRPLLKSEATSRLPKLGLSSRKEQDLPAPRADNGFRETSLAEHRLRNTLSSPISRPRVENARTQSWTSKLSKRSANASPRAPLLGAASSVSSDTAAHSAVDSLSEDIWVASVQSDEHAMQTPDKFVSVQQPVMSHADKVSIHTCESDILNVSLPSDLQPTQDRNNMPDTYQALLHLPVFKIEGSGLTAKDRSSSPATGSLDQRSTPFQQTLSISAPITLFNQAPRLAQQYLSLSPIQVLASQESSSFSTTDSRDQRSTPIQQHLSISASLTLFEQEPHPAQQPLLAQQHLSFSPIYVTASQEPVTQHLPQGLSFAGAKAIIYGCIGFATFHLMFHNLGEESQIMCLALLDTAVAVLAGRALLYVGAHMYDDRILEVMGRTLQALLGVASDTLQTFGLVAGNTLQSLCYIAGDILQGFRDVADEMRQGDIEDSEPLAITFVGRLEEDSL